MALILLFFWTRKVLEFLQASHMMLVMAIIPFLSYCSPLTVQFHPDILTQPGGKPSLVITALFCFALQNCIPVSAWYYYA